MSIVTAIIPVSPQHKQMGIYHDAVESVRAQTVLTDYIIQFDDDGRGAAWARNQATAQATTPFVVWLDADDLLDPKFVEHTLSCYERGAFVYTNWLLKDKVCEPPPRLNPFQAGQQHIITTLMPRIAWADAGGFDEGFDTLEDEDFYRRIAAYGWQGVKCNHALVTYRRDKGFSLVNHDSQDADVIARRVVQKEQRMTERYKRYRMIYELIVNKKQYTAGQGAVGQRQANDVLCEATYDPMTQVGAVTKRRYPKTGFNRPIWVDIDDAQASPHLWRIIARNPDSISPDPERVVELAKRATRSPQPGTKPKRDLSHMTRADLLAMADERGMPVTGTGRNGYVKKTDLLEALS